MALSVIWWIFATALILSPDFGCKLGTAEGELPQDDGGEGEDPTQIVDKALLCFNKKAIYSSCAESYRLTETGDLDIPAEHADEYCKGPCLAETNLVLDCVENILSNFEFYNKATVRDIRDTIHAGCGDTSERGNFNVAEHLQADGNSGEKAAHPFGLLCLVLLINQMAWFAITLF